MKSGVRRSGYSAELLKNGYCPSFVKRCIKMSSLRVTIRGARCGIGLFEVRVLRGVYGFDLMRPLSLVSHGLPNECT